MKRKIITSDKIEDILTGKDSTFIVREYFNNNIIGAPKIIIRDYEFGYFLSTSNIELPYEVIFDDCTFFSPFRLNATSQNSIKFINRCKFSEMLFLDITCKELHLEDVSTYNYVEFQKNCKIDTVSCKLLKSSGLYIEGGEFRNFSISGNYGTISIKGGKFEEKTRIYQTHCKTFSTINVEKLNKLTFENSVFIEDFSFSATKGNFNIFVNAGHFNSIRFENAFSTRDNFFQFNQAKVHELNFDRFSNLGNIYFIDIQPEDVYTLNDGVKTKGVSLKGPKVIFRNSDLGKTTFIDCDLTGFNLEFQSSKISEVFLAGTEMPLSKNILTKDKQQKRLALSQIKKIYENRGDSLTANEYYAEEMRTYMSQLFKNFKFSQIPEILNLILNQISNNFGQSWFLPLIITILVIFISLELFTRSLNFPISNDIWGALKWKMGLMFEYINPTTKINAFADSLLVKENVKLTSKSRFIFGLTRFVIIPYFVYQLIAAFRKHGKKS